MSLTIPKALEPALTSQYPHRPRVLFVLRRRPEASTAAFEQALSDWRRLWNADADVDFGAIFARAGAAEVDAQASLDEQFRASGAEVSAIDGYVSLDLECYEPGPDDFARLFKAAEGCLDTLLHVVDPAESIALAGVANLTIPGFAPLSLILLLDRLPALSVEQYNEWWVRHGADHRRTNLAQAGYHQLHVAPEFNALVARATGTVVTDRCVIDVMYLGSLGDAIPSDPPSGDAARELAEDIGAHVSFTAVSGSFMREL
jgi:hypothetical protein